MSKLYHPKKNYYLFILCLLTYLPVHAQVIRGKIFDARTGEALTGATIQLERAGVKKYTSAKLDGSYIFRDLKTGDYQVKANFIGYVTSKTYEIKLESYKAQITQNILLKDASTEMNEVTIAGQTTKGTDRSARGLEKNAPMVQNILSANAIQLLPDVTVANALQRVSGVTVQRSASGEGRYAIIRGMDQRYNSTLVNGIKIPSPDPAYRFVPMDIFPSEMLERLEVIKALTPSMEGDAIGGSMNLVMKSAPERFVLSANVSGGFSTLFSGNRPFVAFNGSPNGKSPAAVNGNSYPATYSDFNNKA